MKTHLLGVWLVLVLAFAGDSQAQSLLTNGDFETGALFPWTVTAGSATIAPGVPAGFRASATSGTISQTVDTRDGAIYRVSFQKSGGGQFGNFTLTATPAAGGAPDAVRSFSNITDFGLPTAISFTASSDSTILSVGIAASDLGGPATGFVDNISMIELVGTKLEGVYKGTFTRQLVVPDLGISQKVSEKLVANVDAFGRIVMLRGAVEVAAGQIFPDGTFSISFDGSVRTGTAIVKGKRIEIGFDIVNTATDDLGAPIAKETRFQYILTKLPPVPGAPR